METKIITLADYKAWDQYVLSQEDGGVYLTTAWKEGAQRGYEHQDFYLATYSNQSIVGVLPLIFVKPPMCKGKLVSLPFCDYGGILADKTEIAGTLLDKALALTSELRTSLEIRSSRPCAVLEKNSHFNNITNKCRMVLALSASATLLLASFKSKLRSQVNRAGKDGLNCQLGGGELLFDFYKVFSRNMCDLGSPVHSISWFNEIVAAYTKRAKVGVVYKDGRPVAGGIILAHAQTVTIPWASSLREYNRLSPNMLLYWTFLEYAANHGYRFFDFGRSTPDEGTYAFKKQWGAQPIPLFWYRLNSSSRSKGKVGTDSSLRHMIEAVWKRLPLAFANVIGPHLRKYIDR